MTRAAATIALVAGLGWRALSPAGAEVFVYPRPGVGHEAMRQDQYECHTWAKTQTRVDPSQAAVLGPAASGGLPLGAEAGPALLRHDAYGRQAADAITRAQAQQQASLERYERSYAACMALRGYQIR